MNKYKKFIFLIKHRVKVTLLLFVFSALAFGTVYLNSLLKKSILFYYQDVGFNFKTIITNSVINKYSDLLTREYNDLYSNFDYVNQLVKFRAELLQLINGVNVSIILYDKNGQILFDSALNQSNHEQLLTANELKQLAEEQHLFYNKDNKCLISVFSVFTENIEPFLFLKIVQDYYNPVAKIYFIFMVFTSPLLVALMLLVYYLYNKNGQILDKQYQVNLELKNAKAVAEKENINKSRVLANVTHELRTPLNSIIGFSEIIKNEPMGPIGNSQYKEYVNDIYNSGVHLLSLINDVLDFSKAEIDKLVVERIKFDLNKVINSCLQVILPHLQKANITVEKIISEEQLTITADPKRMRQVIINILSNSVKFTPENGIIKLKVEKNIEEKNISIEISDTGIGIVQQDIHKVMSVFGQVDDSSNGKYEGTGLGLPLSKKLVELMGGIFNIKSEPQLGTTLTLIFPLKKQDF